MLSLFVSGYIACFTIRRLSKRIEELEQRVDALTKGKTEATKT